MGEAQTKNNGNHVRAKWLVFAVLAMVLAVVVLVRFSNTPATTLGDSIQAGSQGRDLSTPSSRLVGHTPSLEEIVRSEFKNKKSSQIIINEVSRRTLTGLQGVHVTVDSDYTNQNLFDTNQVKTDVEVKLRDAGINILSKEQFLRANGWPLLLVTASVLPSQSEGSFIMIVKSLELYEQISLERSPDVTLYLATWGDFSGKVSRKIGLSATARAARQEIRSLVEHFADDYFFVNPASTNKLTRKKAQLPFTAKGTKYSNVALVGLTELHVPQLYSSDISVETTIIPQLEKAGITVLSSEQWNDVQDGHYPKKPYLFLKVRVVGDEPHCFKLVCSLKLIDRVILARNPEIIRELPVWESQIDTNPKDTNLKDTRREEVLRKIRQDVQDMMDVFIHAYLSANSS